MEVSHVRYVQVSDGDRFPLPLVNNLPVGVSCTVGPSLRRRSLPSATTGPDVFFATAIGVQVSDGDRFPLPPCTREIDHGIYPRPSLRRRSLPSATSAENIRCAPPGCCPSLRRRSLPSATVPKNMANLDWRSGPSLRRRSLPSATYPVFADILTTGSESKSPTEIASLCHLADKELGGTLNYGPSLRRRSLPSATRRLWSSCLASAMSPSLRRRSLPSAT